jgi:hypothetical protein
MEKSNKPVGALLCQEPSPCPLPEGEGTQSYHLPEGEGTQSYHLPEGEGTQSYHLPEGEGTQSYPLPEGEGTAGSAARAFRRPS